VRDAVIDVDARIDCRGQAPVVSLREIYFASTTEFELLAHVARASRVEYADHRGGVCAMAPTLRRDNDALVAEAVTSTCDGVATAEASAAAHRRH
jgi:hypothetical protein